MPRISLNKTQIAETRERILDIAADIITEEGYSALSMRKIGKRVGMTAANLYNYYANKDEINIAIRLRAGRLLYSELRTAYEGRTNLLSKLRNMIRAYVRFGLEKSNYYSIMFELPTPKYADYVGTPMEELARKQKEENEQIVVLMLRCIEELEALGYIAPLSKNLFFTQIWAQVHGLVSLYNSNALAEIASDPDAMVIASAEQVCDLFVSRT